MSLDGSGSFSDQGMCYYVCMTAGYFRDKQNARSCQPSCSYSPVEYYEDSTTMKCVLGCPAYPEHYFAYNVTHECLTSCPGDYIMDFASRKCVLECGDGLFFDPNSDECVTVCPTDYTSDAVFYGHEDADPYPTCVTATECGLQGLWADDNVGLCVSTCTEGQWKSGDYCVTYCPDGQYGNSITGFCVIPDDCPDDHYANNRTRTCVDVCRGVFADTATQICVEICPDDFWGDPHTHMCAETCSDNLHRNNETRTCVSGCDEYMFLDTVNNTCEPACQEGFYADRSTQVCVETCPSVPPLFGDNDTNSCVEHCDNDTLEYKWEPERVCVAVCPANWYRDNLTRFCV